jgi:hypothetical protein
MTRSRLHQLASSGVPWALALLGKLTEIEKARAELADTRPRKHIVITRAGNAIKSEPTCTISKLLYRASKR